MKAMKKTLAILLALVMVVALGVSAFAADITVDKVKEGETYNAYKILNYTTDGADAYSYYLTAAQYDSGLGKLLSDAGFKFAKSADGSQYVLTNAKELTADAVVAALKAAEANLAKVALVSKTATAKADKEMVFTGLDAGYYFVTTTTGSLCSLASYDAQELIIDKHDPSTVTKTVDKANANVGDTVTYTVTVNAKAGEAVTLKDDLSTGLTLTSDQPTIEGATVMKWEKTPDASKIEIKFDPVKENTTFTVTYQATINSSALTNDPSQVQNKAVISWGHNQSTEVETITKLFAFDVNKVDGKGNALEGVKFTLTNAAGKYYDGQSVWTDKETVLTTDKDGKIAVKGIAAGIYTLTEVETKVGYNLLDKPVVVTVDEKGDVTVQNATNAGNVVTVVNTAGSELPSTGGIGTTIFYILGSILVIGAGVVLVSKRRVAE